MTEEEKLAKKARKDKEKNKAKKFKLNYEKELEEFIDSYDTLIVLGQQEGADALLNMIGNIKQQIEDLKWSDD